MLLALYAYKGQIVSAKNMAEQACRIEIDVLGKPIGKQDQYIAAYGGLRGLRFRRDGGVDVKALASALSNQIQPTPSAADKEPGIREASIVQSEDTLRLRYLTTMDNGRIVTPDSLVAATIGDPASFRVPLKVTRLAQFVSRDGR